MTFCSLVKTLMAKPFVVKLAQSGIDVKTAGDENLVYNSNWPLLKIVKQGSITLPNQASTTKIVDHNLGYVPAFWYISNETLDASVSNVGSFPTYDPNRAEFNGPVWTQPSADSTSLYSDTGTASPDRGPNTYYYYIFVLDITKPYTAPIIKSGGVIGPRNKRTVFKLAKEGKDITSSNMEDYVINSEARSPMVHAVYPFVLDSKGNGVFSHNLGYTPLFVGYFRQDGSLGVSGAIPNSWRIFTGTFDGGNGFIADDKTISYINGVPGDHMSIVVFKDPFNVSNTIDVTI